MRRPWDGAAIRKQGAKAHPPPGRTAPPPSLLKELKAVIIWGSSLSTEYPPQGAAAGAVGSAGRLCGFFLGRKAHKYM